MKLSSYFLVLLFLTCVLLTGEPMQAQDSVSPQFQEFESKIQSILAEFREISGFPGAVVGYVNQSGDSGAVAIGYSDLELQTHMTIKNRLLSGSIGKTYFAAIALQMVAEGKMSLDDKISKYLGNKMWFERLPNHAYITIRMLMNHTAGLAEHVQSPAFAEVISTQPDKSWEHEELISFALDQKPLFKAGEGWSYADTNYIALGLVMEEILGRPLYDELQDRILTPNNLNDTIPSDSRTMEGLIPGYAREGTPLLLSGKSVTDGKLFTNAGLEWTGGGLACTTLDLARWGSILFSGKIIPEELKNDYLDGVKAFTGPKDYYGLGIIIWESELGTCYGHSGWFPGYVSQLIYFKDLELSLAVQFNTDELKTAGIMRQLLYKIAAEYKKLNK